MLLGGWLAFRSARLIGARPRGLSARALALLANLLVTLAGYLAVWLLSPQIFYTYYRLIIPGLPSQWVVGGGAALNDFAAALRLGDGDSLAMSATGLFFWVLAALTLSVHAACWRVARRREPDPQD